MAYWDEVLADNPIAYWHFEETSGTFADGTGNGHTLTGHGTFGYAQASEAGIGTSASVGATTSDYFTAPHSSALTLTGDMTYEAWVAFPDITNYRQVMGKGHGGYGFRINPSAQLELLNDYVSLFATSSGTVPDTSMHHLAVTVSGSTVTFYIDGSPAGSSSKSGSPSGNTLPFQIAADFDSDGVTNSIYAPLGGRVDEVAVFGTALSDARIAAHYAAGIAAPDPPPPPPASAWTFELCDLATDTTLLDITNICLEAKLMPRLNRPLTTSYTLPFGSALMTAAGDGDPRLHEGTRTIKAYQDGELRANTLIWTLSYSGGSENDQKVEVGGSDPAIRLVYRYVYDSVGRVADPIFANPINAADLLTEAIANSIDNEDDVGSPAPLPIEYTTGTLTATTNVASVLTDAPITIGDLVNQLGDTGVCDIVMEPVDSSVSGVSAGQIARLSVVDEWGSDISDTVHFDYATGDKNVSPARRIRDMTTVGNKLIYELGPKIDKNHWKGNITGTELTPVDLSAYQTLALASRAKYGTFAEYRLYDSDDDNDLARPLYHSLWKTEVKLRVNPRDLLYLTPLAAGSNSPNIFRPFVDYGLGDIVEVNAARLGPTISGVKQRIYGFDVTVDAQGIERVSELITSADAE